MYPAIHLFGIPFSIYGFCVLTGCVVCCFYLVIAKIKFGYPEIGWESLIQVALVVLLGALLGTKFLYLLTKIPSAIQHWDYFSRYPGQLPGFLFRGMVFYGGLLGALLFGWAFCRQVKLPLEQVVPLFVPAFPLFHFFGRIGCFFAGCCFGKPCSWGITFYNSSIAPNGVSLFPVQLIEAGCCLVLFFIVLAASRKQSRPWLCLQLYLFLYSVLRFILEFLRGDSLRGVFILSTSQWISLAILASLAAVSFPKRNCKTTI